MPKPFKDFDGFGFSRQYKSVNRWSKLPPLPLIKDESRELPETDNGYGEIFWHPSPCERPCCGVNPASDLLKTYRMRVLKLPAIRATASTPPLPRLPEALLRDVERAELLIPNPLRPECIEESEWQPYDPRHREYLSKLAELYQSADSTANEDEYPD